MIDWCISEYTEKAADRVVGVVSRWFDDKSRKNKAFRETQVRFQAKLDLIRNAGPDVTLGSLGGTDISKHIDKIKVKGRRPIRVLFCRGPEANEITLLGASIEKDSELVEPGIEKHVIERYDALMIDRKKRQPYVEYSYP